MRLLLAAVAIALLAACASIGRPEGGEHDEIPPVYVKSNPAPGTVNFSRNKITIEFDENVQVKDAMTKIVVSPPQKTPPQVMAVGKKINVELRDTLLPNTTYTIDFTDAVSDLNEGNELEGFSYFFSTGATTDTLAISGMVFAASNLEPAQGMTVGVYSNLSDTAITTLPMERITKTDQYGRFTVRNLAPGTYRIYAIDDKNRDYKWDRSEDIAFYDVTLTPSTQAVMAADTLTDVSGKDSIVRVPATRFLPDDVLLTWFNLDYRSQYLQKYERSARNKLLFQFGAKANEFPEITLLNGNDTVRGMEIKQWATLNASPTRDTLEYWITNPAILAMDTLRVEAKFMRTDTANTLVMGSDTLNIILKGAKRKAGEKKETKNDSKGKNAISKLFGKKNEAADTAAADSVPKIEFMEISMSSSPTMDLNKVLVIESKVPILNFDNQGVHLQKKINDSTYEELPPPVFVMPDSLRPMKMTAGYAWEPGTTYSLTIDSLAVHDIYGLFNKPIKQTINTRALEEYSTLTFNLKHVDGPAVVELLNSQDAVVAQARAEGGKATLRYIMPGAYYARIFLDPNDNGKWDIGVVDSLQPEEVYYFPKKLNLKKNWDVVQDWDIFETPIDQQKPAAIKKNKPKQKKKYDREDQYEEEDDDYFDPEDPFGKRKGKSQGSKLRNPNNNQFGMPGLGGGNGLRTATNY